MEFGASGKPRSDYPDIVGLMISPLKLALAGSVERRVFDRASISAVGAFLPPVSGPTEFRGGGPSDLDIDFNHIPVRRFILHSAPFPYKTINIRRVWAVVRSGAEPFLD